MATSGYCVDMGQMLTARENLDLFSCGLAVQLCPAAGRGNG